MPLSTGQLPDTIYRGVFMAVGPCPVTKDDAPLDPRYDLRNHSPDGFQWGYGGSGPSQLAIALVADRLGPGREEDALDIYQDFKWFWVARLPKRNWIYSGSELDDLIDAVIAKINRSLATRSKADDEVDDDDA
jgi:hypothetical protein